MKNRERKGSATIVGGQFRIRKDEETGEESIVRKGRHSYSHGEEVQVTGSRRSEYLCVNSKGLKQNIKRRHVHFNKAGS